MGGVGVSFVFFFCSLGFFMRFGIGLREKIVCDGGLFDDDIIINCNCGCIFYEGFDMFVCILGGEF